MFVGCFITNTIAILFFHFLWLKNDTAIIVIPILERLTYHLMKDRPKNVVKYK